MEQTTTNGKAGSTSNARSMAQDIRNSIASGASSVADTIKEKIPTEALSTAASKVADTVSQSSRYIAKHNLGEMGEDFTIFIRKNPASSVLLGIGVGLLLGTALARK